MNILSLSRLAANRIAEAVDLDQRCLGGLWSAEGYQREIDSPNSDLLILQKLEDQPSALIGMACSWAILDEAHITLLAIEPTYRRQGLGQVLLYALLVLAQQRGMEWATLEVRASNQAAITLYQQFDFEAVGERPRYYQNPSENALILWRKGLQKSGFQADLQRYQQRLNQRLHQAGWQGIFAADPGLQLGQAPGLPPLPS